MKFKKGDVLIIKGEGWKVKVISTFMDEGKRWYEVIPAEFKSIARFVEESKLSYKEEGLR